MTTPHTLTDQLSAIGDDAGKSMEELGRSAATRLDEVRRETGDALHTAAASVRTTGRKGSEAIDSLATNTADRLDATASYVEDHDLRDVVTGLRKFGRNHLAGTLLAGVALGFLAGTALGRVTFLGGRAEESR